MQPEPELSTSPEEVATYHPVFSTLVIVTLLALALGPTFIPLEVSKWYIAAADNHLRRNDLEGSERLLEKATQASKAAIALPDYYRLRCKILAERGDTQGALSLLYTLAKDRNNLEATRDVGYALSDYFESHGDFENSLDALQQVLQLKEVLSASDKNQRAYLRALTQTDLDKALVDINSAIDEVRNESALLDTKAWVLFQQKQYKEAKVWMVQALEQRLQEMTKLGLYAGEDPKELEKATEGFTKMDLEPAGAPSKSAVFRQTVMEARQKLHWFQVRELLRRTPLFSLAVYRYHYARILEASDAQEEADLQWNWLKYYHLEDRVMLY